MTCASASKTLRPLRIVLLPSVLRFKELEDTVERFGRFSPGRPRGLERCLPFAKGGVHPRRQSATLRAERHDDPPPVGGVGEALHPAVGLETVEGECHAPRGTPQDPAQLSRGATGPGGPPHCGKDEIVAYADAEGLDDRLENLAHEHVEPNDPAQKPDVLGQTELLAP